MRRYLLGLFALGLASPALAHEPAPPRPAPDAAQIGTLLSNPLVQEGIAATVDQFANALLQTHVGPLAHYADKDDHIRPDDTLGDLAARDHPNYRRDLHDNTRNAIAATGKAATDLASLTAELQRTSDRLRAILARTQSEVDATR